MTSESVNDPVPGSNSNPNVTYMTTRSGRRRRLISAPTSVYAATSSPTSSASGIGGGPMRRTVNVREASTTIKRPTTIVIRRSPGVAGSHSPSPCSSPKTYIITAPDGSSPLRRSGSGAGLRTYRITAPAAARPLLVGSLDSGFAPESSESSNRSSASNSKKSSPSGSKRSSPTAKYLQNALAMAENSVGAQQIGAGRHASVGSPPGSDGAHGFGSLSPGSYNNRELDDYIIDEILSLEDEQQLRNRGSSKGQPLPVSFSCSGNLTTLSSSNPAGARQHPHQQSAGGNGSGSRPIPGSHGGSSSGNTSLNSGSPIATSGVLGNFRQVVSSSAPSSSFDMESFIRRGGAAASGAQHEHSAHASTPDADFYRDRRKKDIHNMIERRRRYNINDRIKELGLMLPKSTAEDMKLNKGTILKASCDYIRQLQRDRDHLIKQQQQTAKMEEVSKQYMQRIRDLEQLLESQGLAIPSANLPPLNFPDSGSPNSAGRPIKQEPFDEGVGSPSQTPTGSLTSAGFMSQLQEMQITSPGGFRNPHQSSPVSTQNGGRNGPMMVGSLPADHHLNLFGGRQHFFQSSSPIATSNAQQHQQNGGSLSEYGTPSSTWSPLAGSLHQSMLGGGGNAGGSSNAYPDLIMEDLSSLQNRGPLLQGDPMIGSLANSQMSPEIQWDQGSFSPESTQGHQHSTNPTSMDY